MRIRVVALFFVASSLLWSASAMAQTGHVVNPSAMRQAVAAQVLTDQQNRDAVLGVLHHSEVREVAERLGLNITRAETAVATLDSAELARLGASARTADAQMAGGSGSVTISVTMLLVILIIVLLLR